MLPPVPTGDGMFTEVWLSGEEAAYGTGGITVTGEGLTAQLAEGGFHRGDGALSRLEPLRRHLCGGAGGQNH